MVDLVWRLTSIWMSYCCIFKVSLVCVSLKIFTKCFFDKCFHKILFYGSFGFSLSTSRGAGRGKIAYMSYIWISLDIVKAGLTLKGGGGVVLLYFQCSLERSKVQVNSLCTCY